MPAIHERLGIDPWRGPLGAPDGGTGPLALGLDDRGYDFGPSGRSSLTLEDAARQLTRSGLSWAPALGTATTVTFAFRSTAPSQMPDGAGGFTAFTQAQIAATLLALQAWSDVANIVFTRVADANGYGNDATMLFGNYQTGVEGAAAFAYLPGSTASGSTAGDVWVNSTQGANISPSPFNYGQLTLVHEIGHAIGLSHPSVYDVRTSSLSYSANADYREDSRQFTVMSYFGENHTQAWFNNLYPAAPMLDDIAAAQRLYGANMTTRTGDTVYGFNSTADRPWFSAVNGGSQLVFAVWDAGGVDTLDFSLYTQNQVIDLRQGSFSNVGGLVGNVAIARGAVIENVRGGLGADRLTGNSADNLLTGHYGDDVIEGGLGMDTAVFLARRSEYTITVNGQTVTVRHVAEGTDTITNVEFLRFSDMTLSVGPTGDIVTTGGRTLSGDVTNDLMNGSSFADTLSGSDGTDTINGFAGNDVMDGGAGDDSLSGGDGDDTLTGGTGNDRLDGGAGSDLASYANSRSGVSLDLTTGRASGGGEQDILVSIENLRGSRYSDALTGDDNNNALYGNGGADLMRGGRGNDSFFSGAASIVWAGTDIVKTQAVVNSDRTTAVSMDGAFNQADRPDIDRASNNPHATVTATSNGTVEWYAFTATANAVVAVDVDFASFDSVVRVYDSAGNLLATNDDGSSGTGGDLGYDTDSAVTFTAPANGLYYVEVSAWASSTPALTTQPPPVGSTYTLHVTVPGHPVSFTRAGSTMLGEDGDDTFYQSATTSASYDPANRGESDDIIDGGAGIDTVVYGGHFSSYVVTTVGGVTTVRADTAGGTGTDTLTGIEFLQFGYQRIALTPSGLVLLGGPGLAQVNGTAGDDVMQGWEGVDYMYGAGGNDRMTGGAGNDYLYGGTGIDTATYSGARRQYTANSTTVSGNGEGTDTLTSVENLTFIDGTLTFDVNSQAAQVMRLYDAALDRGGDPGGLEGLLDRLERGETLLSLSQAFLSSQEFQDRYGALNNQAFIEQMYRFCLNRNGDPQGISDWTARLNSGTTRAEMLMIFSESQEHRDLMQPTLNQGLWVADEAALTIARLYDATFDRAPDVGGLATWTANLKGGMSVLDIAAAFASAAEFQQRYGTVSNEQFIRQMYQFCLNREPDPSGLATWTAALNSGTSRAQMLLTFSESAEHINLTASQWWGGIRFAGAPASPLAEDDGKGDGALVLPTIADHHVADAGKPTDAPVSPLIFDDHLVDAGKAGDALVLPLIDDGFVVIPSNDDQPLADIQFGDILFADAPEAVTVGHRWATPLDDDILRGAHDMGQPGHSPNPDLHFWH
ncbi:DUF4214 domain-containing protein [Brevundimonas sp. NIBR11]|uniref:DUF4214 domain-containing protein n=1 Tax=Brevundimonas sp. NIBR11 TaxID=3015999 RepID=UPI0022F0EAB4|nr:DUF4214 domain-containing protein [Brevundimonas sp. NIBR11]WGM32477.1 hypothetical protein KKHFBJBL_02729 [Brevundimonas sp. NIBR11]